MGMKVWIDQDLCTGDGLCEEIAPDVFTLLDDGLAYVKEGAKVFSDPGGAEGMANIPAGQERCCRFEAADYRPEPAAVPVYRELYRLYRQLHDGFGRPAGPMAGVMKDLLKLKRASTAS